MKVVSFSVALFLIPGLLTVGAEDSLCVTFLSETIRRDGATCDEVKHVVKCMLESDDVTDHLLATDAQFDSIKSQINPSLALKGLKCDIDYMSVVREIEAEISPVDPTVSEDSVTLIDSCLSSSSSHGSRNCDEITFYVRCLIGVLKLSKPGSKISDDGYQALDIYVNSWQNRQGLQCNVDIRAVVFQIQEERKGGEGSASSLGPFSVFALIILTGVSVILLH